MKVHFTASNYRLEVHYPRYAHIVAAIKEAGHTMTREWIDEDLSRKQAHNAYSPAEYKDIWQKVKMSILKADVVIIEASENSYSIGYQTAFALSYKKPVLVMTDNDHLSHTIIAGEDNPMLHIMGYNDDTWKDVLLGFLHKFEISKQDMRFNMFIDRETQVYLELESYQTGKTKAKIIRDLIKREIKSKNGL